jgi:hypothetical protein
MFLMSERPFARRSVRLRSVRRRPHNTSDSDMNAAEIPGTFDLNQCVAARTREAVRVYDGNELPGDDPSAHLLNGRSRVRWSNPIKTRRRTFWRLDWVG